MYDETGDATKAQGWCPTVLDTNGDGKITKPWNEPIRRRNTLFEEDVADVEYENFDKSLDTRIEIGAYGIIVSPIDGSVWGAQESYPGQIFRMTIGTNPPETCITEVFEVPWREWARPGLRQHRLHAARYRRRPEGRDLDGALGSDHMASFDRSKCGALNGPAAHRPALRGRLDVLQLPSPHVQEDTNVRSDYYYYNWVDQFNTLGLGANTPIATGSGSDSLIALDPDKNQSLVMRVPYPMGFHRRGMDGRIDDPNAGWKGRGIWSSTGADTVWHSENAMAKKDGKFYSVAKPILVKFQVRPDPLAR